MSVTEVVAQLQRAHALLTEARHAAAVADAAISDGAAVFATATTGSTQPEVTQINRLAVRSGQDVRAAHDLFAQAQDRIDRYCQEIAGHGIGGGSSSLLASTSDDNATRPPLLTTPANDTNRHPDPAIRYAEEIAEIRRNGSKISPEKVVRVGRHWQGHLIWLEEGDRYTAGRAHILRENRVGNFEEVGLPETQVIDTIFELLENGPIAGYCGEDGEVYEIEINKNPRRIAIVVSDNGFIVTSYPLSLNDKIRPHRERK
ncbi:hypothetical protein [Actinoalloteichus hymeniacidonis]|uniref:Bacterial EndoU nuclease domain-containing protein n=1 Tax=Actinoalloteichus hymeniacidonis TaxID=340345 RepID=A0AAC9MWP5_9PSEU|nr:hypothetical protein [Actinoalloteichus hymeniacidonis]AOS61037.1 hypothetical protein TL08_00965 [Actinoalloteichus hymeniacidonis]MBB5910963.1 hypothetical protein [Actinoalloteichus hymeniacidonis]